MATDLERLKARRRGNRGVVTRLIEEARAILDAEEITNKGYRRLKVIRGQLEGKETLLAGLNEQILEFSDIADIETDIL